jgi:hypothetical protein
VGLIVVALLIVVTFVIGVGVGNSVSAEPSPPSSNGTSIPIKKGGTGSTTEQGALQNLLPDFDTNNGKVLGSTGTEIGWVEQVKSSDDVGKVKIDNANNTMTTNGETAVYDSVVYSINRPDKWIANTELNFGGGLYGYRATGQNISIKASLTTYFTITSTTGSSKLVSCGGDIRGTAGWRIPPNYLYQSSSADYVSQSASVYNGGSGIIGVSFHINTATISAYDVWVTYKK